MTKPKVSLLPAQGVLLAAECMTLNEEKYPDPVWETMSVYQHVDASLRHLFEFLKGERDPETGMSHLVHACCRILMAVSREVDAERDHQQGADEHLEVLASATPPAASEEPVYMNPRWEITPEYEKWVEEQDRKFYGVPINSIAPLQWEQAARSTKPLWTHNTPSGDTTRIDYEAALRLSTRDSE